MIETLERAGKIHLQQLIAYVESIGFKFNRDEGNWKIYGNAEDKYVVLPGWEAVNKPDYSHRIQDACHRLAVLHPDMMSVSEIIKEAELFASSADSVGSTPARPAPDQSDYPPSH